MTTPSRFGRGVRCHGGFDDDGTYVSPRTGTGPAIAAWEARRVAQFATPVGHPARDLARDLPQRGADQIVLRPGWPSRPSLADAHRHGGGFRWGAPGAPVPDFPRSFDEDISGSAVAHIGGGLFEAHARDEAGHGARPGTT